MTSPNFPAPNHIVESELEYVVPARAVRIFPYNSISYTCLRLEVYGVYITKQMCTHAGMKPVLVRSCVGSRKCGKNAECVRTTDIQGISRLIIDSCFVSVVVVLLVSRYVSNGVFLSLCAP